LGHRKTTPLPDPPVLIGRDESCADDCFRSVSKALL